MDRGHLSHPLPYMEGMALTAGQLDTIADQLDRLVVEIGKARAEVGSPSAWTRISAAQRRAVVLIDEVLEHVREEAAAPKGGG